LGHFALQACQPPRRDSRAGMIGTKKL